MMEGLRLQLGARTLLTIPRRLRGVGLSLDQALAGEVPALPSLPPGHHGWMIRSLPDGATIAASGPRFVRQHYRRHYVDLAAGEAAWRAAMSASTRATLRRKAKRIESRAGATCRIERYRTVEEMMLFHPLARQVAALTYQERLLGSALPADAGFVARMLRLAAADGARGWLLFLGDTPVAYLWCSAEGSAWRYDYVGHDPAHAPLSPGTVLMEAALVDLFADRLPRFDFTEGEGQHKSSFATHAVACHDMLLLRPGPANHAALALLRGFDAGVAIGKKASTAAWLRPIVRRLRR